MEEDTNGATGMGGGGMGGGGMAGGGSHSTGRQKSSRELELVHLVWVSGCVEGRVRVDIWVGE